jgi:hypothetical protein
VFLEAINGVAFVVAPFIAFKRNFENIHSHFLPSSVSENPCRLPPVPFSCLLETWQLQERRMVR